MARRTTPTLAFDSITIEGALISPDWLTKVAQAAAPHQQDADYGVPKGLTLRPEINRYWAIAQAHWLEFKVGREKAGVALAQSKRFVERLLREVFGFADLAPSPIEELDGRRFPLAFVTSGGRAPIAVGGHDRDLDTLDPSLGDGNRRRSVFGLMQDWLNASNTALWGIATNGLVLRLLRDNASLTRPAWIEADLERIFDEERFSDFSLLWLILHHSRFGATDHLPEDCPLESWRTLSRDQGTRARDQLRGGVEAALAELGQGFLAHPDNGTLRTALDGGGLTASSYFQELLRLIYRLIFLLTIEDRELLHPQSADEKSRLRYHDGYALRRLIERCRRPFTHDRHHDLWEGLKVVFKGLARGEVLLALPALGGLFAGEQCPDLDKVRLQNRYLLGALFRLTWLRQSTGLVRVSWRDMGPEELGSVYEGLLDLKPQVSESGRRFHFLGDRAVKSASRKLTGSYYTPDGLVQTLLDSALEPVIAEAVASNPGDPADAILRIRVIDPACGSAHFLLAAARRMAAHVARLRANGTPSAAEHRQALREVVSHCVYGVDRNPMALELARTALWLEAMSPDAPLTFIDHHFRCGDALLGLLDLSVMRDGIPTEAFVELAGDDKSVASALRQLNNRALKEVRAEQKDKSQFRLGFADKEAADWLKELDQLPDNSLEAVAKKDEALKQALSAADDPRAHPLGLAADLYVAAFLAPKTLETADLVPTTRDLIMALEGQPVRPGVSEFARRIAREAGVFHWRLAFAHILTNGGTGAGFDIVLGNPPWETMSPDAKEWFAPFDPEVRELAPNDQERRISELLTLPGMQDAWDAHCHALYRAANFMRKSGRYRMFAEGNLGKGDFNVYRMFVETALAAIRNGGIAAQFVPENLYNGANAAEIRSTLFRSYRLLRLIGFENTRKVWFDIDSRSKFCLYVARRAGNTEFFEAAFGINSLGKLANLGRSKGMEYPVAQVREFSPDAMAIAEIFHAADIAIVQKLYARLPKFGDLAYRPYMREIDMGNDREDFGNDPDGVPLYEGRMVEAFDHRAKAYVSGRARTAVWRDLPFGSADKAIVPQWRIPIAGIPDKIGKRWQRFRIGFCDVASPTNSRSLVACLIPAGAICGHKVPTICFEPENVQLMLLWLGIANALCVDYVARKKISLTMSFSVVDSLPLPIQFSDSALERRIASVVLRLTATGAEMRKFWDQASAELAVELSGERPCEDPSRRETLLAELNVLVARDLFGLSKGEMRYLLDPRDVLGPDCEFETFGALKRAEVREFDEYRTRRLVFEAWDRMESESMLAKVEPRQ